MNMDASRYLYDLTNAAQYFNIHQSFFYFIKNYIYKITGFFCPHRESNSGQLLTRQLYYHYTIEAYTKSHVFKLI